MVLRQPAVERRRKSIDGSARALALTLAVVIVAFVALGVWAVSVKLPDLMAKRAAAMEQFKANIK